MNVALIGSGSWGTAVAGLAAARAERVTMWAHSEQTAAGINGEHRNPRYLVGYELPGNVVATTDLTQALDGAEAIIFAVPSTHLRSVSHQAAPFIAADTPVLCLTKGIEPESGLLMSEVITSEIGNEARVAALSGPNHAEEICRGGLSAAVIASEDPQIGEAFKDLLLSTAFRIYLSQDMTGVEVCGAMKNVIAIVCGISAGTGAGDNTLALIMTRGLAEISRLVHARGGQAMTCMGLAGMGDLIATCTSEHSRNRTFGYEFAHGVSLDEYQTRTHMVVEGAVAARSVSELARSLGVDIPLTLAVEQTLYNGVTLDRALEILTDRVPSQEFYGLTDWRRKASTMSSIKIAPSILSADMANLKGELDKIAGADLVHFDVMDGHFTGNLTFGVDILKAVKRSTDVPVDAHLMVSNPDETVDWYADAGADMITVHYEASTHLHRTLTHLQQRGVKAGVVLNPATPVCVLESIIDVVDMVLLMSVNPGFGGQSFIPGTIAKLHELKAMCERHGVSPLIEVDGGISSKNIAEVVKAGANVLVAGSAVFKSEDPAAEVALLQKLGNEAAQEA